MDPNDEISHEPYLTFPLYWVPAEIEMKTTLPGIYILPKFNVPKDLNNTNHLTINVMDFFLVLEMQAEVMLLYLNHLLKTNLRNYHLVIQYHSYQVTYSQDKNHGRMMLRYQKVRGFLVSDR